MNIFENSKIEKLATLLSEKKKIVITTHINPDGDAIGSSLGWLHFLNKLEHDTNIVVTNEYPKFLQWMQGSNNIVRFTKNEKKATELINNAELLFALDFNHPDRIDRLEPFFQKSKVVKVLIDHHPYPVDFCDLSFSETKVSSTSELVYLIIKALDKTNIIDKTIAECLYSGIMTDTGSFSYNCSNPTTFISAGELISYDININKISNNVYNNFSEHRMRLLGYCLNEKMEVLHKYKTAIISITKEELKKYNFNPGDTEGFVNFPLSIKGIYFSIFLMEKKDYVKLSLRSKGSFASNKFAKKYFEGGGHLNAAGGQSNLNMKETIEKIKQLVSESEELQNL